jgi:hypothetical protein
MALVGQALLLEFTHLGATSRVSSHSPECVGYLRKETKDPDVIKGIVYPSSVLDHGSTLLLNNKQNRKDIHSKQYK